MLPCCERHFIQAIEWSQVVELSEKYDAGNGEGDCAIQSHYREVPHVELGNGGQLTSNGEVDYLSGGYKNCTFQLTVKEDMEAPVYVYYELENFFQNHRRYVKSRSDAQLSGGAVLGEGSLTDCDPLIKSSLPFPQGNVTDTAERVLHPCGLIANSMFNGAFHLAHARLVCWPHARHFVCRHHQFRCHFIQQLLRNRHRLED